MRTLTGAGCHASCCNLRCAWCDTEYAFYGGEKMTIAAAFTDGDSDNLMVGRNGLFYDRKGQDWDATITKIIENPISIRQAFWAPYKKLVRLIEEQVARRAAAAGAARPIMRSNWGASSVTSDGTIITGSIRAVISTISG